jgi:DNA processing protein
MDSNREHLKYLLALVRIPGMGPVKIQELMDTYTDLSHVPHGPLDWEGVAKDLKWAEEEGCYIVPKSDPLYPSLLKEVHGAPAVLFVQGNIKLLSRPQIAIVGSRNPSHMGREIATQFAKYFAVTGFTVTSGLAVGIDAAAHTGSLMGVGSTVAVLAHGLDTIYPAAHRSLAHRIVEKGVLVTEFPIGTPPLQSHFPRRNRVISGLSMGTLVVEAAIKSGSLITAQLALEQGREVFAIPGSIHSPLAKGCHALIRQGAKLVETAEHVIEELEALVKFVRHAADNRDHSEKLGQTQAQMEMRMDNAVLTSDERQVLECVGYECTSVDTIILGTGLTARAVSSMLLDLELQGYLASVPGGYARVLTTISSY